jgi:peptidoglycan/LPS O-acetylase OafA/YrhL
MPSGSVLPIMARAVLRDPLQAVLVKDMRWLASVSLAVLLAIRLHWNGAFCSTFHFLFRDVAFMPPFSAAIRFQSSSLASIPNLRSACFFGGFLYSLYLCHPIILDPITRILGTGPILMCATGVICTVIFAPLVHYLLECRYTGDRKPVPRVRSNRGTKQAERLRSTHMLPFRSRNSISSSAGRHLQSIYPKAIA